MNLTIGKRFSLTSGVLLVLSTLLAAVSLFGLSSIRKNVRSIADDSTPGLFYGGAIKSDMYMLSATYVHHILETDDAEIARLETSIAETDKLLDQDMKGYEQFITQDYDRARFAELKQEVALFHESWLKVRPLSRANRNVEAYALYKAEVLPHRPKLGKQLDALVDWNKQGSDGSLAATSKAVESSWWLTLIVSILSIAIGIPLSWFMVSRLNRELGDTIVELSEGANQIASAASQVAGSSQSLAQGSSQQAATIEETSSTSAEIRSMAMRNSENSQTTAKIVTQSAEDAQQTDRSLEQMVDAMQEIRSSSQKISKIIKVIDDIAFQTNILALNAAVEAARAGESGLGFAVVADEVRSLAQRCAQAAKDTSTLIEESIERSNGGSVKVNEVATAVRAISAESLKIKTLVDEINLGSIEQARGIEQISGAITRMEQVTQSSAAGAEEGAAAAQQLNAQAEGLKEMVVRLSTLVDGSRAGTRLAA